MEESKKIPDSHWENFFVPADVDPSKHVADTCPDVSEFDYIVGSDGSGHVDGCGAYAAIIKQLQTDNCDLVFGSNFGSTVQRNEMQGLLSSLHYILRQETEFRRERGWGDYDISEVMSYIKSYRPIRVLWYTDRQNIANAMLRGPGGALINKRSSDKDLWSCFRWLSTAFLITPYYVPRNEVELQALADGLCTLGRDTMKLLKEQINNQTWLTLKEKLPQKALF